ncbi:hypothetical protein PHYBLDRAFT_139430 [Phycomyces blakesleeanus NRRL 1555(-)]|uniref:DDE Tnp4 domain-containing protein n=1 Tax=Phycomyces blakesleeanus (strain ATCC 8743b / DSM 1359 / FGSC 10004 / NBRC 33097 / NRRL 1555) TaxID=763407 RepID=A0A167QB26_PHYB8|nr:hypothetical protein PHYBLDRAFT_139430 [Phycomyces blakesleeanus NRRL 1555(-)]OAD79399.1 hypothetical protein PHYBLDRAFT_139430 [Phycomyces blakesleeanus NRRL 1555(-)]|eukprot:XP_018297439.1 hypothetical protein PHYBLDRAFT_139430 [Phycomyces blakesleeanus NRRL 1555(-)]
MSAIERLIEIADSMLYHVSEYVIEEEAEIAQQYQQEFDCICISLHIQGCLNINTLSDKDSPVDDCVGFINSTFNKIARPIVGQDVVYNEHYRGHGIKYQAVVTPDGITSSIMGSETGDRHDTHLYLESGLEEKMRQTFDFRDINNGPCYFLYGDPAYTASDFMIVLFNRRK